LLLGLSPSSTFAAITGLRIILSSSDVTFNYHLSSSLSIPIDDQVVVTGNDAANNPYAFKNASVTLGGTSANAGDMLECLNPPSTLATNSYNTTTGKLQLTSATDLTTAQWQAILRLVTYKVSAANPNISPDREITYSLGDLDKYYSGTGHYYEIISNTTAPANNRYTWDQANAAASLRNTYGFQGYLITIASQGEDDFVTNTLGLTIDTWIGATDGEGINGTASTEKSWYWVTGPEKGTYFYNQNTNTAVNGLFNDWRAGEPNDAGGGEDYGQYWTTQAGQGWNDLPNAHTFDLGYVVEYGGLSTDPVVTLTAVLKLHFYMKNPILLGTPL
jgi:hypothetical protein